MTTSNSSIERDAARRARPQYRNIGITQILGYRLPLPGQVSILHRITGVLLFLALPWLLFLFEQSLTSEITFEAFKGIVAHPLTKLFLLAFIWAYLHHFCAGIRFLLLDMHVGIEKQSARQSAGIVLAVSIPLAVVCGLKLFGVF